MGTRAFAGYTYLGRIDVGFYGDVFEASAADHEPVWVLEVRPELAARQGFTAALLATGARLGGLHHRHVVPTLKIGKVEGERIAVATGAAGAVSLVELRAAGTGDGRKMPVRIAVTIVRAVAAALARAHELELCHGAVHPRSIWVDARGGIALADFAAGAATAGAASHARDAALVAGDEFVAPELARAPAAPTGDVFAIGALGFWLFGDDVPPAVARCCTRATAPDPAARPATAGELQLELERAWIEAGLTAAEPDAIALYAELVGAMVPQPDASDRPASGVAPGGVVDVVLKAGTADGLSLLDDVPPLPEERADSALAIGDDAPELDAATAAVLAELDRAGSDADRETDVRDQPGQDAEIVSEVIEVAPRAAGKRSRPDIDADDDEPTALRFDAGRPVWRPGDADADADADSDDVGEPDDLDHFDHLDDGHVADADAAEDIDDIEDDAEDASEQGARAERAADADAHADDEATELDHAARRAVSAAEPGRFASTGSEQTLVRAERGAPAGAGAATSLPLEAPPRASPGKARVALRGESTDVEPEPVEEPASALEPLGFPRGASALAQQSADIQDFDDNDTYLPPPRTYSDPDLADEAEQARAAFAAASAEAPPTRAPTGTDPVVVTIRRGGGGIWILTALVAVVGLVVVLYTQTDLFHPERQAAKARAAAAELERLEQKAEAAAIRAGDLVIDSEPAGAAVWLLLGRTPVVTPALSAAVVHQIRVEHEGFVPRDVDVVGALWTGPADARTAAFKAELEPGGGTAPPWPPAPGAARTGLAGRGRISIDSTPQGAAAYLLIGVTPDVVYRGVRAGQGYELKVVKQGYAPGFIVIRAQDWLGPGGARVGRLERTATLSPLPKGK